MKALFFILIAIGVISFNSLAEFEANDDLVTYHPFNGNAEAAPRAYEPFKELERKRQEAEMRARWQFAKDRVVIRMATQELVAKRLAERAQAPTPVKEMPGIKSFTHLFPEKARPAMAAWRAEHPVLDRWMLAELKDGTDVKQLIAQLNENSLVDIAEPDYLFKLAGGDQVDPIPADGGALASVPNPANNPSLDQQWHLDAAKVKEAWQYLDDQGLPPGGSSDVIVAVIDSGVDYTHPDLAPNMWVNSQEIPDNNIDDDGNGIVDDIHGADFLSNRSNHNGNPRDDSGHGTHVAGITAAVADNDLGGVGVAYNARIMAIKAAHYTGVLTSSDIAESIYYAVENGADVINMSFGGPAPSSVVREALEVAFGQAILVASAGNEGMHTEKPPNPPFPQPFYPASFPFVLGVMAENSTANARGEWLAGFSNWDSKPSSPIEYEIMAPGTQIYSTLPGEQYAAWNGTSMAAPVAAGVAALVRTRYPDKNVYSSRFIMGQLASTGTKKTGKVPGGLEPISYFSLDGKAAVSSTPEPGLALIDYQVFDDSSFSDINDGDSIVDAGETIELAVVIKNRWGKADPVSVTLAAQAAGSVRPDPYVTWDVDTVNYGAIGNFGQDDNGITSDEEGAITGVTNPFRFTVSSDAPNEHVIPIAVTMTAGNGFDSEDSNAPYEFAGNFSLIVQKGRSLPSVIEEDLTMTKNHYWIVERPVLIPAGVTVTITEGAQLQFWNSDPLVEKPDPFIRVEGALNVIGTADQPVEFFPAALYPNRWAELYEAEDGAVSLDYFKVINPAIGYRSASNQNYPIESVRHGVITQSDCTMRVTRGNGEVINYIRPRLWARECYKVAFKNVGGYIVDKFDPFSPHAEDLFFELTNPDTCLINNSIVFTERPHSDLGEIRGMPPRSFKNTTFLNPYRRCFRVGSGVPFIQPSIYQWDYPGLLSRASWQNNAVLLESWRQNPRYNYRFYGNMEDSGGDISSTFWGTTSLDVINDAIVDRDDNFAHFDFIVEPLLTEAPESAWPFVTDVVLSTEGEADIRVVGAEVVTFTVTFNRDMATSEQPSVSFGPDEPATDFTVNGDWQDARTWVGTFVINSIIGDGYQLMRVTDAVAADDPWLITGKDFGRFRFEIVTSGTEALTLQASGGEGFVDLSWGQDDYELLAGYNLYRADGGSNFFQRINSTIIPVGTNTYRNTNVEPGQNYDYYFKVVLTDMSESESSNTATATPLDTIPAVLSHSPITSAQPNLPLTIAANITDNVAVTGAILHHRLAGSGGAYSPRNMVNTTGDRWTATLGGSLLQSPGVEYYLSATDGVSTTFAGRSEVPYLITVDDRPVVTGITPNRGPASGGTALQVTGTNFKEGATVTFGSTAAASVSFVSSTQLDVTTPAHIPSTITVTVTNPGDRAGTLLNGFTFINDLAGIYLSDVAAESGGFVSVPLDVANVSGLVAFDVTITYDPTKLSFSSVTKGTFLQDWTLVSNSTVAGEIRLSSFSGGAALAGSGSVAVLEFQALGQPGDVAALTLSDVSLNGGAITPTETGGSITVEAYSTLSGTARFWGDVSKPVENVFLNLEGAGTRTTNSDSAGGFTFSRLPLADYELRFSKTDEKNGITAYDAALALRHSAGLETLSGNAATAANVNRDERINSMDAYRILQHSVGLQDISIPGGGVAWVFDPPLRSYTQLNQNLTGQDASAILLGDVSGNWSASTPQGGEGVNMQLHSVADYRNDRTLTRVLLQTGQETLSGADIVLSYDPSLRVNSVTCPGFTCASNTRTPGQIQIALASASGVSGDQTPVEIEFGKAVADPGVVLSRVSLDEGRLLVTGPVDESVFDQDGDGLLDTDEAAYFGTKFDLADSDGDGQSDAAELFAATDPADAGSVLRILGLAILETGDFRLSWKSASGTHYQIERSSTLHSEDWTPIGEIIVASSGETAVEIDKPNDLGRAFYRIGVVR